MKENPSSPQEISQTYYLMTVQPHALPEEDPSSSSAAGAQGGSGETPMETELPKAFLRVANFMQLDTFAIVHGPCTKIDRERDLRLPCVVHIPACFIDVCLFLLVTGWN